MSGYFQMIANFLDIFKSVKILPNDSKLPDDVYLESSNNSYWTCFKEEYGFSYGSRTMNTLWICRQSLFRVFLACGEKLFLALCPESFCTGKVAIWKVLGFCASGFWYLKCSGIYSVVQYAFLTLQQVLLMFKQVLLMLPQLLLMFQQVLLMLPQLRLVFQQVLLLLPQLLLVSQQVLLL